MNLIAKKFPNAALIDGKWVTSNKTFSVLDPATGDEITTVPNLGAEDATRAIDAAARALPAWSAKTAKERAIILKRWFDLVTAETESLAQLMTTEQGKPLAESRAEVAYGAAFIEWFAEEGKRAYGRTIPTTVASKRYITIKQPIGVVAAIAPWNFPIAMITRKVAPALASGCTIVVKPAAETPLCALALAKLGLDAGLPPGVLNIVTTKRRGRRGPRLLRRRPRAQALLHRLDRGRQAALPSMRRHGEEAHARARRQRASDRVRRRQSRPGRRRRHGLEISQRRPDLRLRQPHPGAIGHLRPLRRRARRGGREARRRTRARSRHQYRSLDQQRGDRQGREPCRRRRQEGREAASAAASPTRRDRCSTGPRSWAT